MLRLVLVGLGTTFALCVLTVDAHAESATDQPLLGSVLGDVKKLVEPTAPDQPEAVEAGTASTEVRAPAGRHPVRPTLRHVAKPVVQRLSPTVKPSRSTSPVADRPAGRPRAERPATIRVDQARPHHRAKPVVQVVVPVRKTVRGVVAPVAKTVQKTTPTVDATLGLVDRTAATLGLTRVLEPVVDHLVTPTLDRVVKPVVEQVVTPVVEPVVGPVVDEVLTPVVSELPPVVVVVVPVLDQPGDHVEPAQPVAGSSAVGSPSVGSPAVSPAVDAGAAAIRREPVSTRGPEVTPSRAAPVQTGSLLRSSATRTAAVPVQHQEPATAATSTMPFEPGSNPTTPLSAWCAAASGSATGVGGVGSFVGVLDSSQHSLSAATALLAVADLGATLRVPRQPGFAPD